MNKRHATLCGRRNKIQIKGGGTKPDPRPTVYDALGDEYNSTTTERRRRSINSIGRLDYDTTGLLLFTTDGWLHHVLASPQFKVSKIYEATLRTKEPLSEEAIQQLKTGVQLPHAKGATVMAKAVSNLPSVGGGNARVQLEITNGYKHQVKLMLKLAKRPLSKLHRRTFANLELPSDLKEGEWRELTDCERNSLYELAKSQEAMMEVCTSSGDTNTGKKRKLDEELLP